jgi:hypothetical protein
VFEILSAAGSLQILSFVEIAVGIFHFLNHGISSLKLAVRQALFLLAGLLFLANIFFAQEPVSIKNEDSLLTVDGVYPSEVFSVGKNVLIRGEANGVLCFGCDVIVEGQVTGDVSTVGGSVFQKETAFIGGDVIVFFGKYLPDNALPLRSAGKQTVIMAGYEEEAKNWAKDPLSIFAPEFTVGFISMRLLALLFWFIVSLVLATIAPGAVGRSVARFQLSLLSVVGFGFIGFVCSFVLAVVCAVSLQNFVGVFIAVMILLLLFLSYVYGRVTLQAVIGKWLLRKFSAPGSKQSEAVALLIGSAICTLLISLPYVWTFSIFVILVVSVGLVLTGIFGGGWKKTEKV